MEATGRHTVARVPCGMILRRGLVLESGVSILCLRSLILSLFSCRNANPAAEEIKRDAQEQAAAENTEEVKEDENKGEGKSSFITHALHSPVIPPMRLPLCACTMRRRSALATQKAKRGERRRAISLGEMARIAILIAYVLCSCRRGS